MKNWTVRQRIIASFSVVIAILLVLSISIYIKLFSVERSAVEAQTFAVPGMQLAGLMRLSWTDHMLETQRLLIAAKDETSALDGEWMTKFQVINDRLSGNQGEYLATIRLDSDRQVFQHFIEQAAQYQKLHEQMFTLLEAKRFGEAQRLTQDQMLPVWTQARLLLTQMFELNQRAADQASQQIVAAVADTKLNLMLAMLAVVVVAMLSGLLLIKSITKPVEQIVRTLKVLGGGDLAVRLDLQRRDEFNAIEEGFNSMANELTALVSQAQRSAVLMTTSVTQIAATSREQQATATETAATTIEIGATSREISATARDLVRTMTEVSGTAEQTSVLAGSGQLGLVRMEDVMHQVATAADVVNAKLAILNEKASTINHVVTTIVKVADQTNLLSLNAAIEAEKAGEYGRGFAVVATQVRRLADQTAVATYDIEQMVREIQSAVSAGVMGMDKFSEEVRRGNNEMAQVGDQLSQIIHQVQALAPQVQLVNEGMQAQATGAEQINQALEQLTEASGQTVESLRQAGSAIEELNQVSSSLRAGVSRFKVGA